jgi:CSLREA domain-containing protein
VFRPLVAVVIAAFLCALLAAPGAGAATIPVTTTADVSANDGLCSLREAVSSASVDQAFGDGCVNGSGADTITVPAGHYTLTAGASGSLGVGKETAIVGAGASQTTIDGNGSERVFDISSGSTVLLSGMTITNGKAPNGSNAGAAGGFGGGVENFGTLTIENCVVAKNRAGNGASGAVAVGATGPSGADGGVGGTGSGGQGGFGGAGGGIYSLGALTVINSRVIENSAGDGGTGGRGQGGFGGTATGGAGGSGGEGSGGDGGSGGVGGGILAFGELTIRGSEIRVNRAGAGGTGGSSVAGSGSNAAGSHHGGESGISFAGEGGAGGSGGGVVAFKAVIETSTIAENIAGDGGAGGFAEGGYGGNGTPAGSGGAIVGGQGGAGGSGGGLDSFETLTLARSALLSNRAGNGGAGGDGSGTRRGDSIQITLAAGGVGGAGGSGGGLFDAAAATRTVTDTTIDSDATGNGGHGGNDTSPPEARGADGGAAGGGGGIDAGGGAVAVSRSTITFNTLGTPGPGGTGANGNGSTPGPAAGGAIRGSSGTSLGASIVFQNAAPMCSGTIANGLNDIQTPSSSCPGANVDPQLQPLADNGGPTLTREIAPTSPAVDLYSCEGRDQRGVLRPSGLRCDSGAFEVAPPTVADPRADPAPTGATLHATVNPNARANVVFEYGTTTAYGTTSAKTIASSAGEPIDVAVPIAGLTPLTTYHFRARVTSPDGEAVSQDGSFVTSVLPPPAPGTSRDTTAPTIKGFAAKPKSFSVAPAKGAKARKHQRSGTKFHLNLSEAASLSFAIERKAPCKKKGHKAKGKSCSRYLKVGTVTAKGKAGADVVAFSGRIGSKALRPGAYQAVATATDAAGNRSRPATAAFTVVKPSA